jgi:L,D-transpeptidase YcbB
MKYFSQIFLFLVFFSLGNAQEVSYNPMEILFKNRTQFVQNYPDVNPEFYAMLDFVYSSTDYSLIWTNPLKIKQLTDWVNNAPKIGFDNKPILKIFPEEISKRENRLQKIFTDIDYTLTYLKLYDTFYNGTVKPEERGSNFFLPANVYDSLEVLNAISQSADLTPFYSVFPKVKDFPNLVEKAILYYNVDASGGWPSVDADSLYLGRRGPVVLQLKNRLIASGEYTFPHKRRSDIFDREVEAALKKFQFYAGIDTSGVLDSKTLYELNFPAIEKWKKLVLNIERWMWFPKDFGSYYAIANIPAFKIELYENDSLIHSQKVVVGRTDRMTPVFYATMTYLDFNPTWTVPPNILANDIVPAARKNVSYLQKKNIKAIDYNTGQVVNYNEINWSSYRKYAFVQDPGPSNSLGNVKFVFPNKYFIFFHDTPTKSHFALTDRAYSSGCIRLEDALALSKVILRENQKFSDDHIQGVIKSRKTTRVPLTNQPKVYITYFTVETDENGNLKFYRDIYGHDKALGEKLGLY